MVPSRPQQPILVIEDDNDSRTMLTTLLDMEGFRVVAAANGAEGLRIARQSRPCLILLDLMMPVMSGPQFREAQMADSAIRDVPTIVLSARHDAAHVARELGCQCSMPKPVDAQRLAEMVASLCATDLPRQ